MDGLTQEQLKQGFLVLWGAVVLWAFSSAHRAKGKRIESLWRQEFFQINDVIYDDMETWLWQDNNFEERRGQLGDLIGYIWYHYVLCYCKCVLI